MTVFIPRDPQQLVLDLALSRSTTMLQRDMRAATCNGVHPATSARSKDGRCRSNSETTLPEPLRQAT